MVFNDSKTAIGLALTSLPALLSLYFFFFRERKKTGVALLLFSAFLMRLLMISLDPFVQEWDERFHALVGKHMMEHPFKPMLILNPILAQSPLDWGSGHIWVHKQPLFLWQMGLSMKLFGINTFAMRLPSAIMGTIMVWMIFDVALQWMKDERIAFIAAFIGAFAYYSLELTSGRQSLEHNDLAFTFYVTCSLWAFTRFVILNGSWKWALLVGVFAGCAILNKWLTGLLVYGGWGLYLLLSKWKSEPKKYLQLIFSIIVCGIVFIPWQLYILKEFPAESAIAFGYNFKHMSDNLGHPGSAWFHIRYLRTAYHNILLLLLPLGIIYAFKNKALDMKLSISFMAMIVAIFLFFSILVATKMSAFVYPVSALIIILSAAGLYYMCSSAFNYLNIIELHRNQLLVIITLCIGYVFLKPIDIATQRSVENQWRNNKIHNATIYKNLEDSIAENYVILNCRPYENIELMFYKNTLAYHWYPEPKVLDSLQAVGYKFAAFEYKNDPQQLPKWITSDSTILILDKGLK